MPAFPPFRTDRLLRRREAFSPTLWLCLAWLSWAGGLRAAQSPAVPPSSDPLLNLLMQQPATDTTSPVVVQAEFDPPVAREGAYVVYRVSLNALNDSVKLPENLPIPPGLKLEGPTRGQALLPQDNKLVPKTTLLYRVSALSNGVYRMPSFELEAYRQRTAVPAATVTILEKTHPRGLEALHLELDTPTTNVFVGQAIPLRILLADPAGTQVLGLFQVQIEGEAIVLDTVTVRQRREMLMREGRPVPCYVYEQSVFALKEGDLALRAQAYAMLAPVPGQAPSPQTMLGSTPMFFSVRSVPTEGRLPGYTGLIGTYQLEAPRLSTNRVRAGEPVLLTFGLKGVGNSVHLIPPRPPEFRDWRVFPPSLDPASVFFSATLTGRFFSYTLVPLSAQVTATPAIPFCYFDPGTRSYRDLSLPPQPIQVLPAPAGQPVAPLPVAATRPDPGTQEDAPPPKEPQLTGLVDSPGRVVTSLTPLQRRPWFLWLQLVPVLALLGIWLWNQRRTYLELHPEVLVFRRARRAVRQRIAQLEAAAAQQDTAAFVSAAVDALREAAAPLLEAEPQALVCADLLAGLPAGRSKESSAQLLRELFTAADGWRFARRPPPAGLLLRQAELLALIDGWRQRLEAQARATLPMGG